MANQVASVEIQAKAAGLAAQLREARAKFAGFANDVEHLFNAAGKKAKRKGFFDKGGANTVFGKMLGTAGGNLISAGVSKATGYLEEAASSAITFGDKLLRLQITASATPEAMAAFSESVSVASKKTGKHKDEILDAAASYVALTGDMDTAKKSIAVWTDVAQATNSTVADIASSAAALTQQMNIKPEDMLETFGSLAKQGKEGAIEIKDLAAQLSTIAPQWAQFGGATGKGARGVREMGAALQIAKRGFGGDAGETVTGLAGMLTALQKHADRFGAKGVKVFEADGKSARNVLDIVRDIKKKNLGGAQLINMFGRTEGYRAYMQLAKETGGALDEMANAGGGAAMIMKDLNTYLASPSSRMERTMNNLKNSIAEAFTPERIEKFASAMEKIASAAGTTFKFLSFIVGLDPGKEEGSNHEINELTDTKERRGEDQAIAQANKTLALKEGFDRYEDPVLSNSISQAGGLENAKAGARKYLDSVASNRRGMVPDATNADAVHLQNLIYQSPAVNTKGNTQQDVANTIARTIADVMARSSRAGTLAIVENLKNIQINLTADGAKIVTAGKNSAIHGRSVKK